jgi:hypothetical protein
MSDDAPPPPFIYDGLDPVVEEKSVISEVADAVRGPRKGWAKWSIPAANPGMPLSVLSNIDREAPLGRS